MELLPPHNPAQVSGYYTACPVLVVADVSETVAFYKIKLGFHVPPEYDNLTQYGVVQHGRAILHFVTAPNGTTIRPNHLIVPDTVDVFLEVSDVDAICLGCEQHQITIIHKPETYTNAIRKVVIEDLNGYWLCFGQAMTETS